ncbi:MULTISPECIES: hypothetical protein [Streptomyces]|nr:MULTISPECIES: hypothetical protein [Streptomyces]
MATSYVLVELSEKLSDSVDIECARFGFEAVVTGHGCTGEDRTHQD